MSVDSVDEKTLVVAYTGEADAPPQVSSIIGEYRRTEPGCFRKEGGGKISFDGGYWYFFNRLGEQVAWVESGIQQIPNDGWRTRGEANAGQAQSLDASGVAAPISVAFKAIPLEAAVARDKGPGCSEACELYWSQLKDMIPHEHRETVASYEQSVRASTTIAHSRVSQHTDTAMQAYREYAPVVREKSHEAYTACFEFWTHPDTQDTMKKMAAATVDFLKYCAATCMAVTAGAIDQGVGSLSSNKAPDSTAQAASESEQAMDASYIKVDSSSARIEPSEQGLLIADAPKTASY